MKNIEFLKKIKMFLFLVMMLSTGNIFIYSIFRTPEAGRYYYWIFSPELTGKGMGIGGTQNPSGVIINPASNAYIQRIKIEASYGTAPGLLSGYIYNNEYFSQAGDFFWPFIINAGVVVPTKYFNFTIYTNYMNMSNLGYSLTNNNDLGIGKIGSIYFAMSKDYSEHFALGISGNLKFGYNTLLKNGTNEPEKYFDVAGGLDLGLIWHPEINAAQIAGWGFQDFETAVTLKDLGKPFIYFPKAGEYDLTWFASPFTPSIGISFNIFNNGATYWKLLFDLSTPFCQNLKFAFGTEVQIFKFLVLRSSYTFDLEGTLEFIDYYVADIENFDTYGYIYNLANTSFGLSFKFRSDFLKKQTKEEAYKNRHKTTSFSIDLGFRPYHQGFVFETGCTVTIGVRDETPPEINYVLNDIYASPNLDGIQDAIVFDLDIKDERYVTNWKLVIKDETGKTIRIIQGRVPRKEGMKAKDVVKKFFAPKSGIPIPKKVIWDCKDQNGNIVADGKYTFTFYAIDDNKNENKNIEYGDVIIDTEKPKIDSKIEDKIFSPNDDGNKDTLIIDIDIIRNKIVNIPVKASGSGEIKSSRKQEWIVDIINSKDEIVRTYKYYKIGSFKLAWDGKDKDGQNVEDGVYMAKLHSTDEAGNYWEEIITNIIIDTTPTPIKARILNNVFSPNGDAVKDNLDFTFDIPIKENIIAWQVDILNNKENIINSYNGNSISSLINKWDGKKSDSSTAPEGEYTAKLSIEYRNGNKPFAVTPGFELDLTPPDGKINISKNIFSPDGDGNFDFVTINHSTTTEEEWYGHIINENNNILKSYTWKSNPPSKINWNGKDDNNKLLKDGKYYYKILCTDLAGNNFESDKKEISIFTENTPVFITSELESFSPNGDKVKDNQVFDIHANLSTENRVIKWNIEIFNETDIKVFEINKNGELDKTLNWNGFNNENKKVTDGIYYAKLLVYFEAGNRSESKSNKFSIDTIKPEIELKALHTLFSPNDDGYLDEIEILQKSSKEELWEAKIINENNQIIWKKYYKGFTDAKQIWNGYDTKGNILKNGFYTYIVSSTDNAGNTGTAKIDKIEIKNLFTNAFITLSSNKFSPNNDENLDEIYFKPIINIKEGIEIYQVNIINSKDEVVKIYNGKDGLPDSFEWDGFVKQDVTADEDDYRVNLKLIYNFGNRIDIVSSRFILDTEPPEISLKYTPEYFSPDNDGIDDILNIDISAKDRSGIKEWKITILSPDKKKEFISFSAPGNPTKKILWNGMDKNNELVESAEDYPVKIYAVDEVGNILNAYADDIPIDILVIRLDDGRLKIKISNIQFQPNSELMTDSPKNKKILDLIARALKKYRLYTITVEGHANKFKHDLNEDIAKTLSFKRANTVVTELVRRGIPARRMTPVGRGFDDPLVPLTNNADFDELAKNRRVEFYLEKN